MMFNTLFTLAMTLAVAAASPLLPRNTSSSDISAYLSAHNNVRSQHRVSPLTWSNDLATKAQSWANGCVFQHSGGKLGPYGGESRIVMPCNGPCRSRRAVLAENLAAGTGSSYGIAAAIKSWTDEVCTYLTAFESRSARF